MPRPSSAKTALATFALALLYVTGAATFVDPDAWHLMSLAREALALGHLPLEDRFAYTPTVYPVVHHEWATGMIVYWLAMHGGLVAMQVARAVVFTVIAVSAVRVARMRGASAAALVFLAPLAIIMGWIGLTAMRAQVFTLACLSVWLGCLERDRRGERGWIAGALVLYVAWLNLHAGFVVGVAFMLLHTVEQWARGKPYLHLVATCAALGVLVFVNPYGWLYLQYLAGGLTLDRHLIAEWRPIWQANPIGFTFYLASAAVGVYALASTGLRAAPGWPLLVASAYMAFRHERHVSIYALVWFSHVPALVVRLRVGETLGRVWATHSAVMRIAWSMAGIGILVAFTIQQPWRLTVPATRGLNIPPYPVGAVDYLAASRFHGNLMVPFDAGAYVTWKLHPAVKVSFDSRFEAAYPPGLLEEHQTFYDVGPGWETILGKYPTDAVLIPTEAPVAKHLGDLGWSRTYQDDFYAVFARAGTTLPVVDDRGQRFIGSFP
jgi:hypothetical protein